MSDLHTAWARLFAASLVASGVRDVVVSPGSRSTPLTLAFAATPGLRCHSVIDERAAGFFALGIGRATGAPAVLLCTSGTAVTHYHPAVVEAYQAGVPMVVLSADRPWEAQGCASPQTIDQSDLFARVLRHRAELGPPTDHDSALRAVVRIAAQSVAASQHPAPGPVHINAQFRKPLEPLPHAPPEPWTARLEALRARAVPRVFPAVSVPSPEGVSVLAAALREARRPLLVAGPAWAREAPGVLDVLAHRLGAPLLVEATSAQRFAPASDVTRIGCFDLLLRAPAWRDAHAPDLVLELGLPPTSGQYAQWLGALPDTPRAVIAPTGFNDPLQSARWLLHAPPAAAAAALCEALDGHTVHPDTRAFTAAWAHAESVAQAAAAAMMQGDTLHEGRVVRGLCDALPDDAVWVVGNSMPVRDLDSFTPTARGPLRVMHQRGASGIDGLFAGAAGVRAVTDAGTPVALLLGDVSAAHDLASLSLCARAEAPLVLVVVHNAGGRIFAELPLGRRAADDPALAQAFTEHFLTAPTADFVRVAEAVGVRAVRVHTAGQWEAALAEALRTAGATLVEAVVPPEDGGRRRASLASAVGAALEATRR